MTIIEVKLRIAVDENCGRNVDKDLPEKFLASTQGAVKASLFIERKRGKILEAEAREVFE